VIVGLGIDVVAVARIRTAMKSPRFLPRILTEQEIALDLTPERVAGRWAVKEALSKALPGLKNWHDVEVLNGEAGEPVVRFPGGFHLEPGLNLWVSISHERGYAAAVAVVEKP
jgi:holo-[acyl-carrier protein] synthase